MLFKKEKGATLEGLSKEDESKIYNDFKDYMKSKYPSKKILNIDSFFGRINPHKKPSFLRRFYHRLF